MKRSDKFRQANREAKSTILATLAVIVFWLLAGFGLAGINVTIFHTPLWVLGGCIGTWFFAILVSIYLADYVFKDIDLDEEEPNHEH